MTTPLQPNGPNDGGPDDRRDRPRRTGPDRRSADRGTADRRSAERRMEGDPDSTLARMLRLGLPTPLAGQIGGPGAAAEGADVAGVPLVQPADPLYFPLTPAQTALLVREALAEDEAFNDVTTLATVVSTRHARGHLVARQPGTIAGVLLAVEGCRCCS